MGSQTECSIYFAAGCFWGAQKFFKMVDGVVSTCVGFANGMTQNPSYQEVYTDTTGHAECVLVKFNPTKVSLEKLVELFLKIVDPFSVNKQGEDVGTRYRTGIYFLDDAQGETIKRVISKFEEKAKQCVAVEIRPLECFYTAEEYHQNYLDKNPNGYCHLSPEIFTLAKKLKGGM
ncbi:MAG: peptide-methionine (S)-S-oxide reductase MsrA [Alistipes sp.]|nr:peptide-methionine (S)-S-oxide reductase MsrA [Candidatus Alistipes equi]